MMKSLLENFRSYSLLSEEQLLIEGRKEDAAAKYPELAKKREELDGESLLDPLIAGDPSGNQKYLKGAARLVQRAMDNAETVNDYVPFWGKQWPEDADNNLYSPWGIARNIADLLPKYHGLMAYIRDQDAPFKDINNIKAYSSLQAVVKTAQEKKNRREQEKKDKAQLKKLAHEGSEVIADTPYHLVVRPLTKEASCYFGRETRWCISATKAQNYFDSYTSDGKAFLFLIAKRKDVDPAYAKVAVVMDREGNFDEYYDAEDDNLYLRAFEYAVMQTLIGVPASNEIASHEEDEEVVEKDVIIKGLEPFKGEDGFDFDENDSINDIIALFRGSVLMDYIGALEEAGRESVQDTPPGTPDEAYEEKLAEFDFDNFHVSIEFPYETGAANVYWDAYTDIDLDNLLERAEGWEATAAWEEYVEREADEIRDVVETIMTDLGVWSEEIEQNYGDPAVFNIRLETGYGSLDDFEGYLNNIDHDDNKMNEGLLDAFIETASEIDPPLIRNPEKEEEEKEAARQQTRDAEYWPDPEEKKKQIDLPLQENRFRIKIIKSR